MGNTPERAIRRRAGSALAPAVGLALAAALLSRSGASRAQEPTASDSSAPASEAAPAPSSATAATLSPPPRVETVPRQGLLIGGAITFGFGYMFSLIGAGAKDGDSARSWLYVPVAGPFVFLGTRQKCPGSKDPSGCVDDFLTTPVFTAFGITQAIGAALFASGFLFPRERVVHGETGSSPTRGETSPPAWIVTPAVVGQSGLGVAAAGTLF